MKTIIISNKRKVSESEKSYTYSTKVRGGKLFFIPKKGIVSQEVSNIRVNEVHVESAVKYVLQEWAYNFIKEDLGTMNDFDFIMPDEG